MSSHSSQFGFNLHDAARLLRRDFDRRARELGLSRSRWQILWHLSKHEGTHQAGLADLMDVAPISLARQLDRLELEEFVERRSDPKDRRRYHLYLTAKARPMLVEMQKLAAQTKAVAMKGFNDQEIEQLVRSLSQIRNNLSRHDESGGPTSGNS